MTIKTHKGVNRIVNTENSEQFQQQQRERGPTAVTITPALRCPTCLELHASIKRFACDHESNTRSCVRCRRVYNEEEAAE